RRTWHARAPPGGGGARRRGPASVPRLRGPARPPPHARPGAQGGPRLGHPRRGRRRLRRGGRDAEHRPGGRLRAGAAPAARGGVLALHEEDPTLSGAGAMHEGTVSARLGLAGIPSVSESTPIARDAALARYEDGRIHIQHLSARESVEAVAEAKARGVRISCE